MKITKILCVVGCLVLGVVAACHAYEPSSSSCCTSCSSTVKPVNDILTKLEALKAKKDAIELEERPLLQALKKEMKTQQARMAKLGIVPESSNTDVPFSVPLTPPMMTEVPKPAAEVGYYEPLTSYRKVRRYDPETQTYKDITTPVTTYIYRTKPVAPPAPPAVPSVSQTPFLFDSPYSLTQPK